MTHHEHRYEWQVIYRRWTWSAGTADKRRVFGTEEAARRFLARLLDDGRPDLADLERLELRKRPVGEWELVRDMADPFDP